MKLNAGILTEKLSETKSFYTQNLGFRIQFENDFYLLLTTPNEQDKVGFLKPNHQTQHPFFHKPFLGEGLFLTIEVEDVDKLYFELKKLGVEIKVTIRDEPWGERHFAIEDPNGIGIDIIKYIQPFKA
ncbi:VOC family protein [Flammeovirgaceae bacterium SG7u.111]|nr:VOC family protein [Flammeovirgaceae bacterium SG7u.132]WPO36535.1 VOC family protein [Flammeovirgaceae bacterium SG7u.111]